MVAYQMIYVDNVLVFIIEIIWVFINKTLDSLENNSKVFVTILRVY